MLRIVALALALSGLCLCSPLRADDTEDKAVAFVKDLGGEVTRGEKAPGKPVTAIDLSYTPVTDADLKKLAPDYLNYRHNESKQGRCRGVT